ncbi:MAG: GtrA family protein [Kiloniellaceae bacterium]
MRGFRSPDRLGRSALLGLARQYLKFATVGGAATVTHVGLFAALIEWAELAPLLANLAAFCTAVGVSFLGHYHWTFAAPDAAPTARAGMDRSLPRFALVALFGLGLNSLVVYVVTGLLALSYLYAIAIMVSAVPVVLFALNKFWAFASPRG